jgi:hypothetical protein
VDLPVSSRQRLRRAASGSSFVNCGVQQSSGGTSAGDEPRAGGDSDVVFGGADNDQLFGDDGNEADADGTLNGEDGNDTLAGCGGDDQLKGVEGNGITGRLNKGRIPHFCTVIAAAVSWPKASRCQTRTAFGAGGNFVTFGTFDSILHMKERDHVTSGTEVSPIVELKHGGIAKRSCIDATHFVPILRIDHGEPFADRESRHTP